MADLGRYLPTPYTPLRLEDVGTRLQHYMELLDLWGIALDALLAKKEYIRTDKDTAQIEELTVITSFLTRTTMNIVSGYDQTTYAREINALPRDAQEIKD